MSEIFGHDDWDPLRQHVDRVFADMRALADAFFAAAGRGETLTVGVAEKLCAAGNMLDFLLRRVDGVCRCNDENHRARGAGCEGDQN